MNPDLIFRQMRDIEGIDPIGLWPLAPGWWLVLAALVLVVVLARAAWRRFGAYRPQAFWRRDAANQLRLLRRRVGRDDGKQLAADLSELLRRIAMARCGRDICAGLHGDEWLSWLQQQDPNGFDWPAKGRLLIELPYAPPGLATDNGQLYTLLDATQAWVMQAEHCPFKGREARP